jgi:hypothetical protein
MEAEREMAATLAEMRDLLEKIVCLLEEQNVILESANEDEEATWRDPDT